MQIQNCHSKGSSQQESLFTSKLDLNLKNYSLFGAEIWTLSKVGLKYLDSFEMSWRRMEKTIWTDRLRNDSERGEKYPTYNTNKDR
jgi:hypothetical protein